MFYLKFNKNYSAYFLIWIKRFFLLINGQRMRPYNTIARYFKIFLKENLSVSWKNSPVYLLVISKQSLIEIPLKYHWNEFNCHNYSVHGPVTNKVIQMVYGTYITLKSRLRGISQIFVLINTCTDKLRDYTGLHIRENFPSGHEIVQILVQYTV